LHGSLWRSGRFSGKKMRKQPTGGVGKVRSHYNGLGCDP